ncbi:IS110 family transposase [Mucilaginibacter daejeonensis]|uniref:IS110 family transposase n=1 Tax=Mucilaginibacter daejeonensis TaxID=398049 RepID=UPI001D176236|nr:IS110 family transposase [Mucilaginibacter daejeonensis]UEG54879.1 IS110 family transposase [Mucilaginibacter daejeonensis]
MDVDRSLKRGLAKKRTKNYNYIVGVDVSKNKLDYAVMFDGKLLFHKVGSNDLEAIHQFLTELKALPSFTMSRSFFCMENTGYYCNHLLSVLRKVKANVCLENALQIKSSLGLIRGKYDKIDAVRIASYALKNARSLRLWIPKRPEIELLAMLDGLRTRLQTLQMSLRSSLKEQSTFIKRKLHTVTTDLCTNSILAVNADLVAIEREIDALIQSDPLLKRLNQLITSVPNVGPVTAVQIILTTNEFKDISQPKKFACYAGVAPFVKDSGLHKGKGKVSPLANRRVKALLHICSLNAIRHDREIKFYYHRKAIVEGKPKMAVLNAVRNKLINRIFACVNQDRVYRHALTTSEDIQQVN